MVETPDKIPLPGLAGNGWVQRRIQNHLGLLERRQLMKVAQELEESYFDCLPQGVRIVVYTSSMEPINYAVANDRTEPAHCVANASGTPSASATSSHTEMPRTRAWQCPDESVAR